MTSPTRPVFTPIPPVINDVALLARVGGNASLAASLLGEFAGANTSALDHVDSALSEGNVDAAFRAIHQIAGTAGNLGLERLAAAAKRSETALSEALKTESPATSPHLSEVDLDTIERCLCEALVGCRVVIARLSADRPPQATPSDLENAEARLRQRLVEELTDARLEALDTLEELAPFLGPEARDLRGALARLDFTTAAGILRDSIETE